MDRVELGIKLEQIGELRTKGDYIGAAKVADTIDWRRVKKWSELCIAEDIYEKANRPKDARNICVYAYNRNLGGKRLIVKLTELSIQIGDFEEADDLYREFVEIAPRDMERYILLYKLNKARKAPEERLIEILEEYKQSEFDEQYGYELAELYAKVGRIDDCVRECDNLILWFNEGDYVEKALRLKMRYADLTRSQKAKLQTMQEFRAAGLEYSTVVPEYEKEVVHQDEPVYESAFTNTAEATEKALDADASDAKTEPQVHTSDTEKTGVTSEKNTNDDEIVVPEKDYSIYDTQNIQLGLAKSLELIMSGIKVEPGDDSAFEFKPIVPEKPTGVDTHEITAEEPGDDSDMKIAGEEKTASDENQVPDTAADQEDEVDVDLASDVLKLDDEVDEPTKEIRINTHHWKRYTSVMVDEDKQAKLLEQAGEAESGLPKYIVEKSVVLGVADTDSDYVVADVEHVTKEEQGEQAEEEVQADAEPQAEEVIQADEVQADAEPQADEAIQAEEEVQADAEPQAEEAIQPETASDDVEETDEALEGQINLMDWLKTVPTEADKTPEDKIIDAAMDEMAAMLIEEVTADIEKANSEKQPTAIEEEEYVSVTEDEASEEEEGLDNMDYVPDDFSNIEGATFEEAHAISEYGGEDSALGDDEEDEDNHFALKSDERKYLRKYLFIDGLESTVAQVIYKKKNEISDGTSNHGNIVVTGRSKTDKTGFAVNLFKALHAKDENKDYKVAKTSASMINKSGIMDSLDKIKGTTLIVENAGQLSKESAKEIELLMSQDTDALLVIFTGEEYAINRIFFENPKLAAKFDYSIDIRTYTVNELVTIAKEYARTKGYSFGEKALLSLYLALGEIVSNNNGKELNQTKELVDKVIEKNNRKGKGRFGKQKGGLIQLKDKDFS